MTSTHSAGVDWLSSAHRPAAVSARPLRVLVAHNVPRGRNGGMNRIMAFIHDEIEAAGHQVEYFSSEDTPHSRGKWARFAFPLAIARHAERERAAGRPYDIINVHEPSGGAVVLRKGYTRARVVVTSHGLESRGWQLVRQQVSLKSRIAYPSTVLWQANLALKRADHIFCLNEEDVASLESRHIPHQRITRIFPAADPVFGAAALRRDYRQARTLLFAGTWITRKGIREVSAAFSKLAAARPELCLIVLNPGVPDEDVLGWFPSSIQRQVSCRRAAPEEGVARVFAEADIYLLPSEFEGTPLTLMEAMWSALPVIATATCGMRDVLRHEQNGLLIPIRSPEALLSAAEHALDHPELRARLGCAAYHDAVSRYTWRQSAEPVRSVYEQLAA